MRVIWMALPICKTCKHYAPDRFSSFESSFAGCKKIGTVDVVTGQVAYSSARETRMNACGEKGILYEPERNLALKKMKHFTGSFMFPLVLSYLAVICSWVVILKKN